MKDTFQIFREAFLAWLRGKSPRLGAALSYYTIFAIAPLLLLTLTVAGLCFGEKAAHHQLFSQLNGLLGPEGGHAIESLITAAGRPRVGIKATIAAVATLVAGATAVFVVLQDGLNTIWGVQREPGFGIRHFIKDRLLSFAMVLGIGFLLLVSLVLNAILSGVGEFAGGSLQEKHVIWGMFNFGLSLGVITLLFALILKVLPDAKIAWRDVWVGAFVTALLFNLGKFLIGFYLGRSTVMSVYGAAGSFIVLLLWVYYSAQILFFGAEFTHVYAAKHERISPQAVTPCHVADQSLAAKT